MFGQKWIFRAAIFVVACFGELATASAQTYLGLGVGNASYSLKSIVGYEEVDDGVVGKVVFGQRTANGLGFELDISGSSHDWNGLLGAATHDVTNFVIAGTANMSVAKDSELFGKLGINMWSTTVDVSGSTYEGDDGFGLAAGGGLEFRATKQIGIRGELLYLPGVSDGVDDGDVTELTLQGLWYFQ